MMTLRFRPPSASLERAGHHVVTASDGRRALDQLETGDFDLLFLDIFMPGMDGFETMRLVNGRLPWINSAPSSACLKGNSLSSVWIRPPIRSRRRAVSPHRRACSRQGIAIE